MSENGIVDQANRLILYVSRTIPFRSGLDRHLIRAARSPPNPAVRRRVTVDPSLRFKISPLNELQARESGLRLEGSILNAQCRPKSLP